MGLTDATDWQSMQTAPKDGRPIVLWFYYKPSDDRDKRGEGFQAICKWQEQLQEWVLSYNQVKPNGKGGVVSDPCYWRNLPTAPPNSWCVGHCDKPKQDMPRVTKRQLQW